MPRDCLEFGGHGVGDLDDEGLAILDLIVPELEPMT